MRPITTGDTVAYSAAFLRSIGCQTGDIPFARGVVNRFVDISPECRLAEVFWDTAGIPPRVNVKNLCRPGSSGFSA
jgi:hypothetical protein